MLKTISKDACLDPPYRFNYHPISSCSPNILENYNYSPISFLSTAKSTPMFNQNWLFKSCKSCIEGSLLWLSHCIYPALVIPWEHGFFIPLQIFPPPSSSFGMLGFSRILLTLGSFLLFWEHLSNL